MSFSSLSSLLYSSRVTNLSAGGVVSWLRPLAAATSNRSRVPARHVVLVLIIFRCSFGSPPGGRRLVSFSFCFLGCESAQVVDHIPAVVLAKSLFVGRHRLFAFGEF